MTRTVTYTCDGCGMNETRPVSTIPKVSAYTLVLDNEAASHKPLNESIELCVDCKNAFVDETLKRFKRGRHA